MVELSKPPSPPRIVNSDCPPPASVRRQHARLRQASPPRSQPGMRVRCSENPHKVAESTSEIPGLLQLMSSSILMMGHLNERLISDGSDLPQPPQVASENGNIGRLPSQCGCPNQRSRRLPERMGRASGRTQKRAAPAGPRHSPKVWRGSLKAVPSKGFRTHLSNRNRFGVAAVYCEATGAKVADFSTSCRRGQSSAAAEFQHSQGMARGSCGRIFNAAFNPASAAA